MMLATWSAALTASALLVLPAGAASAAITTELVTGGLERPLFATAPPGDTGRLFLVEQHSGRIRILDLGNDTLLATDFLDLDDIATDDEQGLLGLAFHPEYAENGYFYVNLTRAGDGDTEIRRYEVSSDPDVADEKSGQLVLSYVQPQNNHNGGWMGFGPDGFLYIASGDGGGSNDAGTGHTAGTGNAQDITDNLLGKILRIDVDGDDFPADAARNYAIPPSNPFVGVTGDDEIWSYGLRNPWRASFDRNTGDFYIGDVGQSSREEIDVQRAGDGGGQNYGWRLREGTIQTPTVGGARPSGAIDPIYDYTRGSGAFQGRSVTGGYVYRGPIEEIQGHYFFADFATARIWSLIYDGSAPATFDGSNYTDLSDRTAELDPAGEASIDDVASFGEDAQGNLYIVELGGQLFRVIEAPDAACGDPVEDAAAGSAASLSASDALFVLRTSVGSQSCALCVCDVNDSGDVTATDALAVLRAAVGSPVELTCPACP
ncbi:MAG TPA: PQQ-dependent sugar dehydrogenase [Candidatus Limnocylindrales bacterium]|nr:PQQ-dependent sugar dehydrogenase [Candidatus Limnocylindrales bacterium]